ncbi:hypothetical protein JCM31826_07360 [Thermaurantimonas aggregans]|uniref:DUF4249 domain-containing protein n=1 Tax=Thermaurantimonas aggregans TaxID=2173829 RepID=A0A401XJT8_9FLAO|nr:DUF4249 family protein [Thermaurantimonas aggregans]MCX8148931.1 DUF4249 domain-containing protein [Thermaurantimonas aggregans]GCD77254.1 hypothetical protein JCM31826_07360 [Thermaurantimonas aggregans]
MKKNLIAILALTTLFSCETIIDLDIDFDETQMAVNAVFCDQRVPGDSSVIVWVSDVLHPLSKRRINKYLTDGTTVALFENGQFVENLQKVEQIRIDFDWVTGRTDTLLSGYFKSTRPLIPGNTYKVVANHPGKKEVSHTYTHVPRVIPTSVKLTNPSTGEVTITFNNPEGIQTYLISITAKSQNPATWEWVEFSCLDPNFQAYSFSGFDPFEPDSSGFYTRFGFYVDNSSQAIQNQTIKLNIRNFDSSLLQKIQIEFGVVSESFPRYVASYFAYYFSEDSFFSTPEPIFGNSSNGIGVSIGLSTGKFNIQP